MHCLDRPIALRSFLLILLGSACLPGCSGSPNPVASNVSFGPDDQFATRILDASERQEVLTIMRGAVDGPTDDPARPAPHGARWKDVTLAATLACKQQDLAILSVNVEEGGLLKRIEIISVGDIPYELQVRRLPPPEIFAATATGGLFEERTREAARLVRDFEAAMLAFGAKPGWSDLPNE